jgi:hypothetical protein
MSEAKPPVQPVLHSLDAVEAALEQGDVWSDEVRETMAYLGVNNHWPWFYSISETVGMEVSMLVDAEGLCFIDWGTISRVGLNPPKGATIPFQIWTHTHPRGDSYWSLTDRQTLAVASVAKIIRKAIVLGRAQMKESVWSEQPATKPLAESGPLSHWSDELVQYVEKGVSPWRAEVEA